MNNEAIASILSALAGNDNAAQPATSFLGAPDIDRPAQTKPDSTAETVKNLAAIAERRVSHAIIGPYVTDDQKEPVARIVGAVNYFGPGLAYRQADTAVKDLQKILDDVERNIMNNLTQVLRAAGIRM